jgi:hypothetical protein
MPKITKAERAEAIASLRALLSDGSTVFTVLRHVSASGRSRRISLVVILPTTDGSPDIRHLSYSAARALGWHYVSGWHDAIRVGGCGMDMGFHLVDSLASAIGRKLHHRWL